MKNENGWDQLICRFFYAVCLKRLGSYFFHQGFVAQKSKINGVLFKKGDLFVEISYILETSPKYSPSIVVGVGNDKYDDLGNTTGVPVWRLIPEEKEARKYSFWKFSDEAELEKVLDRIKSEIIEQYTRPLWEDRAGLLGMINGVSPVGRVTPAITR